MYYAAAPIVKATGGRALRGSIDDVLGEGLEREAALARWQAGEVVDRDSGEPPCLLERGLDPRRSYDHVDRLVHGLIRCISIVEDATNRRVIWILLEQVNRRQRDHPLTQIAPDRFTHRRLISDEVQDVVDHLERHSKIIAVLTQSLDVLLGCTAENRARLGRGTQQGRSLPLDLLIVIVTALAPLARAEDLA